MRVVIVVKEIERNRVLTEGAIVCWFCKVFYMRIKIYSRPSCNNVSAFVCVCVNVSMSVCVWVTRASVVLSLSDGISHI